MTSTKSVALCLLLLFALLGNKAGASPMIGPAVEQNGLRFESWLAMPKIKTPVRGTGYESSHPRMLFSTRVTNLLPNPVHFDPFALDFRLFKPNGKEVVADPVLIAGYIRMPTELDYLVLQPGQVLVLQTLSNRYWYNGRFCLSWSSKSLSEPFPEHPSVYGGLAAGNYEIRLSCKKLSSTVQIRKEFMGKITTKLTGFWTGNVTLPPLTFQLVTPPN